MQRDIGAHTRQIGPIDAEGQGLLTICKILVKGWIVENSVESVNKSAVFRLFIAVESVNS